MHPAGETFSPALSLLRDSIDVPLWITKSACKHVAAGFMGSFPSLLNSTLVPCASTSSLLFSAFYRVRKRFLVFFSISGILLSS